MFSASSVQMRSPGLRISPNELSAQLDIIYIMLWWFLSEVTDAMRLMKLINTQICTERIGIG